VTLTANGVKLASRGAQLTGGSIPEAVLDASALTKPPAALPTPTASTNARTFEAIRANLQACFAAAPAARASATALLTACAPAFASDYPEQQLFGSRRFLRPVLVDRHERRRLPGPGRAVQRQGR
jgi:hypothetical protein